MGGKGENVNVGEKGRFEAGWACACGGVKGRRDVDGRSFIVLPFVVAGSWPLVVPFAKAFASSIFTSFEATRMPPAEGGGCVADVGVGSGCCCCCDASCDLFALDAVDRRFLAGGPLL